MRPCSRGWRKRNVFAITSFIFGMDNDTVGVAERTLQQIRNLACRGCDLRVAHALPGTPLPSTRLKDARPADATETLVEFKAFAMAHTPLR